MDFCNSYFILCFLPIFLIVFYLFPVKCRTLLLIIGSLIYYGVSCPNWLPVLGGAVLSNYVLYLGMMKTGFKKTFFSLALFFNVAFLCISKILPDSMPGVSFFVFCVIALFVDSFRGEAERMGIGQFCSYLIYFPKMISGPVTRWSQFKTGIVTERETKLRRRINLERGLALFISGLGYKVLLADRLAGLWNEIQVIGVESISTPLAWLGMYSYSLQLFFDFQGYSLMAIGIAQMMGIKLPDNFNYPYTAKTVSDFYRRWHITLGVWFRDYVYIPLGGSRRGGFRTCIHLAIVWLLTGLWHGIGWNFLLWCAVLWLCICMEKLFLRKTMEKSKLLGHLYVLTVIPMTWIIFAVEKIDELEWYFCRLFGPIMGIYGINVDRYDVYEIGLKYVPFLVAGIVFALFPVRKWLWKKKGTWYGAILLLVIFWGAIYELMLGSNNPFLYFQF